jgi:tetratricopeptide (TPR) repeat protein
MKLSLCMIVKNEQTTLPNCLNSVKDVVDEMVILDTGSTDQTPKIAQEFGAQVYDYQWSNDFSAARNESLAHANGDWILVLDADEQLNPEIIQDLKAVIEQESYLLVNLVRQEIGASQSPYSMVSRLFRNHPEVYFSRPYHALVDDSVSRLLSRQPEWKIASLASIAIWHEGYHPDAIAGLDKVRRAQQAMEGYLAAHPNDPYTCCKLGALYVQIGKIEQGIHLLEIALKGVPSWNGNPTLEPPVLYELHYHLGIAYTRLQKFSKAKTHYRAALNQPILPALKLGAYNNLGNVMLQTGDLTGAKTIYEAALKIDPNLAVAHFNLGITFKEKGKIKEAIAAYRQAIEVNPYYAEAYQNLGVILLKIGNILESLEQFRSAVALYEERRSPVAYQLRQSLKEIGFNL